MKDLELKRNMSKPGSIPLEAQPGWRCDEVLDGGLP